MKRIGVITSGGDAPGMNAALRAVVRTALRRGVQVTGFLRGYEGMVNNEPIALDSQSVGGIISRGGTILRSARSKEFREIEGRKKAMANLRAADVDGLVVIGGDGSLAGALRLKEEFDLPVMGVPASIDNDIPGTDYSIGFITAVNTAIEAIDRVRDTAYSHERVFVIEVMGRKNGFIALEAGLAGGAEAILIPEVPYSLAEVCGELQKAAERGKRSCIVVVAEGAARAVDVRDFIERHTGAEARYLVLGHMQRGGSPTALDRVLALRLGSFAAHRLIGGFSGEMAGVDGGRLVSHPLSYVFSSSRTIDPERLLLASTMAQ
ncbi:MAG: 6-phosphofructokinase [Fimbriimonadaceae bacterium]|uniref:ATP-dependent 6-phosphofructokinase n=1 Tax=Candidatus Nitrosymbiomonas proteolyticus TaxID=2608984 RepID=A0A809RFW5_9BACT|nr:6-phosphofructokinase [Armatimonadota bacterium]MCK6631487.1 6-phosphofructokinase [Fimbriimonadaceae bacterium]QOJ11037.1 MAG: 6-phosphofructokinase [Chthonomonadaceae bacterium]BBO23345.1 6-phosphofructokinase [Candidatus Nitrosymbiomonas proteolyticus]MCL4284216.1 6-phosphofructokinase [Fimbriimonadaceae bacterium]